MEDYISINDIQQAAMNMTIGGSNSDSGSAASISERLLNVLLRLPDSTVESGRPLIEKITVEYIMNTIEKEQFARLHVAFERSDKRGVGILEFVRIFFELNEFKPEENLFHLMSLVDLYQQIQQNMRDERNVRFSDFTDFHYEYFQEKDGIEYKIPTYQMPPQKIINGDFKNQRDIDTKPTQIIGRNDQGSRRLNPETLKFDCKKHRADNNVRGQYAKELKELITLDSFSGQLSLYDSQAQVKCVLKPQGFQENAVTLILSFAWSNAEQRIGVCLKDFTIVFWEKNDNFKFQKSFSTVQYLDDYSTDIWYLEQSRMWITTNKQNQIYVWSLVDERLADIIATQRYVRGGIIKVMELTHLRLVAIASVDKQITIWNFNEKSLILTLPLLESGIHHMIYSYEYQLLLTAGFEQIVYVYSIHPKFYEYKLEGRLIGHSSMVTSVQEITGTEMVISADDQGLIKIWDIRTLGCLQNINLFIKSGINEIIYIPDERVLCFLSSRVGFMRFDEVHSSQSNQPSSQHSEPQANNKSSLPSLYPVHVEFDTKHKQFAVCTSKDLRVYNADDGRNEKIIKGLLESSSTEITQFYFFNQQSQLIVSDDKGANVLIEANNTSNQTKLSSHLGEVRASFIDYKNKQLISGGKDSMILVQQLLLKEGAFEVKRTLKNVHFGKGIMLMDFSYYQNLIVTATDSNEIFLYDYEYLKCIGTISLPPSVTPTALHLVNGYSLLAVASSDALVYVFHIARNDQTIKLSLLAIVDLQAYPQLPYQQFKSDSFQIKELDESEKKRNLQTYLAGQLQTQIDKTIAAGLAAAHQEQGLPPVGGKLATSIKTFQQAAILLQHVNQVKSLFKEGLKHNLQTQEFIISKQSPFLRESIQQFNSLEIKIRHPQAAEKNKEKNEDDDGFDQAVRIVSASEIDDKNRGVRLYVGRINGEIVCLNLQRLIEAHRIVIQDSYESSKKNFNPFRVTNEVFDEFSEKAEGNRFIVLEGLIDSNETLKKILASTAANVRRESAVQAHKTSLHTIQIIPVNKNNFIISSSVDGYFKIWDDRLRQCASMNVNHPLPITWTLNVGSNNEVQKKLYFAVKILDLACKKFSKDKVCSKFQNTSKFLQNLMQGSINSNSSQSSAPIRTSEDKTQRVSSIMITTPKVAGAPLRKKMTGSQSMDLKSVASLAAAATTNSATNPPATNGSSTTRKVNLMKDFYAPYDLQFEKIKDQFANQMRGPTLKQMESIKRVNEMRSRALFVIQNEKLDDDDDIERKMRQADDRENVVFLMPQYRDKILKRQKEDFNDVTKFQKKIDNLQYSLDRQFQKNRSLSQMKQQQMQNFKPSEIAAGITGNQLFDSNGVAISGQRTSILGNNQGQLGAVALPGINASQSTSLLHVAVNMQSLHHQPQQGISNQQFLPHHTAQQSSTSTSSSYAHATQKQSNRSPNQTQKWKSQFVKRIDNNSILRGNGSPRVPRTVSDFFQYAGEKNLFRQSSERFETQLNQLSSNPMVKQSGISDLSMTLKDDNFLDKSTQPNSQEASILNIQRNKVQLLKRLQEKTRMNDIMKNLNKQIAQSKFQSHTRYPSSDANRSDTTQPHTITMQNSGYYNHSSSNQLPQSKIFPTQIDYSTKYAVPIIQQNPQQGHSRISSIEKFKVINNSESQSTIKRTASNRVLRQSDISLFSQQPSFMGSKLNVSQL